MPQKQTKLSDHIYHIEYDKVTTSTTNSYLRLPALFVMAGDNLMLLFIMQKYHFH